MVERRFPDAFATAPYQFTDLDSLGLTARECHEAVQWIDDVAAPATTRSAGRRAMSALVRHGGRSVGGVVGARGRAAGTVPTSCPCRCVADGVYPLVAANRQRLPGGTAALRRPERRDDLGAELTIAERRRPWQPGREPA